MNLNPKDKKINISCFYKSKELFNKGDIDVNKYQFQKNSLMVKKAHLNTLFDIAIMIGYVKSFNSNKTMSSKVIDKKNY